MPRFNRNKRTPIGIDVGRKRIKAVQLRAQGSTHVVTAAASMARSQGGDSPTLTGEEIRRLNAVLHRQGFVGNEVVLSTPAGKAVQSLLELPPVTAAIPLESLIRNELCAAQRLDASQMQIAYWPVPAPSRGGKSTFVMAIALPNAEAQSIVDSFAAEKLDVIAIDVGALAVARGCELAMPAGDSPVAIIDLGWTGLTITVVLAHSVVSQRVLPEVSLSALVTQAAHQTRLKNELVEQLLGRADRAPVLDGAALPLPELPADVASQLSDVVRTHVELLATEVQTSIGYVMQNYPDRPAACVRLVGGGSTIGGVDHELQDVLRFECVAAAPANCSPQMTLASGLALHGAAA